MTAPAPATISAPNPLPADIDWRRVETTLGVRITQSPLQSDVVHPAPIRERKDDLLCAEADPVDRVGKFANLLRLRGILELGGLTGADGDVLPGFVEGFSAAQHVGSPHASVAGAPEGKASPGSTSPDPGEAYAETLTSLLLAKESEGYWLVRRFPNGRGESSDSIGSLVNEAHRLADEAAERPS